MWRAKKRSHEAEEEVEEEVEVANDDMQSSLTVNKIARMKYATLSNRESETHKHKHIFCTLWINWTKWTQTNE